VTITLTAVNWVGSLYGKRIPTVNGFGWMNHSFDPITKEFINDCKKRDRPIVLEIGAGTGLASIDAIKNGAFVWVNDLHKLHLSNFIQEVNEKEYNSYKIFIGGFPNEFYSPQNYFDSILAARVLHFFSPQKLQQAISRMLDILKPGGKVFILAVTPYHQGWESIMPEYEQRKKKKSLYPGYIEGVSQYNPKFQSMIPEKIHFLDPVVLHREFEKAGFIVTYVDYIQDNDNILSMLATDRSLVGLIAQKPNVKK